MANYILMYVGGDHPESQEARQQHFQDYQQWLASISTITVSAMNPLKDKCSVSKLGVGESNLESLSGYTIIKAESLSAAQDIAKKCPFIDINGTIEVAEIVKMT